MIPALITGAAAVLAVLVTTFGQWLNSRNDRQLTLLEVEILAKLPVGSTQHEELEHVVNSRIRKWHNATDPFWQLARALFGLLGFCVILAVIYTVLIFAGDMRAVATALSNSVFGLATWVVVGIWGTIGAAVVLFVLMGISIFGDLRDQFRKRNVLGRRQP